MEELPIEILLCIFACIYNYSALTTLFLVSKKINGIAKHNCLWYAQLKNLSGLTNTLVIKDDSISMMTAFEQFKHLHTCAKYKRSHAKPIQLYIYGPFSLREMFYNSLRSIGIQCNFLKVLDNTTFVRKMGDPVSPEFELKVLYQSILYGIQPLTIKTSDNDTCDSRDIFPTYVNGLSILLNRYGESDLVELWENMDPRYKPIVKHSCINASVCAYIKGVNKAPKEERKQNVVQKNQFKVEHSALTDTTPLLLDIEEQPFDIHSNEETILDYIDATITENPFDKSSSMVHELWSLTFIEKLLKMALDTHITSSGSNIATERLQAQQQQNNRFTLFCHYNSGFWLCLFGSILLYPVLIISMILQAVIAVLYILLFMVAMFVDIFPCFRVFLVDELNNKVKLIMIPWIVMHHYPTTMYIFASFGFRYGFFNGFNRSFREIWSHIKLFKRYYGNREMTEFDTWAYGMSLRTRWLILFEVLLVPLCSMAAVIAVCTSK